MSLLKRKKELELKYLDQYIWMFGYWWERTIDHNGSRIEGLIKVKDVEEIPPKYFKYYEDINYDRAIS